MMCVMSVWCVLCVCDVCMVCVCDVCDMCWGEMGDLRLGDWETTRERRKSQARELLFPHGRQVGRNARSFEAGEKLGHFAFVGGDADVR